MVMHPILVFKKSRFWTSLLERKSYSLETIHPLCCASSLIMMAGSWYQVTPISFQETGYGRCEISIADMACSD